MKINYFLLAALLPISSHAFADQQAKQPTELATTAAETYKVGNLEIKGCWARPGQQQKNTAMYMTIKNTMASNGDRLIKAECLAANAVELHDHINEDGIMKMRPVDGIAIKDTAELKPGSLHIMLMGLKQDLKEGEHIEMKLSFEKAGAITVKVPVQKPKV